VSPASPPTLILMLGLGLLLLLGALWRMPLPRLLQW
jgi:hypothetical protein